MKPRGQIMAIHVNDTYTWCVLYQDGTKTPEFDEIRPDGRGFAEVEDKPVQSITLARVDTGIQVADVAIPEDATPIFFRRRARLINPNDGTTLKSDTTHCIGWQCGDDVAYLFVFDDGTTLLTKNLQAV